MNLPMGNSLSAQYICHKYDLIRTVHMGSSLLGPPGLLCRQFDLWVRYRGESISRQDHLNFYKWLSFEFAAPNPDLPPQNRAEIPYLGNFSYFCLC
ncbi:MAG: hypothetical protein RL744_561 [Pseudomonadota bacterium]